MIKLVILLSLCSIEVSSICQSCFPTDFLWGASTSSYQIEGAWNTSGKGENIWDWFTHSFPEKIKDGSNGDVAADSYNKYLDDVELLKNLGANVYRLSLSWSRILPNGTVNNINQEGVDYYINLLTALRENNIEPVVTIYHWDLPLPLHEMGGWTNPLIVDFYNVYADLCFSLFGDLVKYWLTLNESISQCYFGYGEGTHAPGYQESGTLTYICAYTQLLAHAKAYRTYNDTYKQMYNGEVGVVLVSLWYEPLTDSDEDKTAAENGVQWALGLFGHPIFIGNWPQVIIDRIGNLSALQGLNASRLPEFTSEEIELIKGTYDYMGFNYYTTFYATPINNIENIELVVQSYGVDRNVNSSVDPAWTSSASGLVYDVPTGIRSMLNWVAKNFGNPRILITENGWASLPESSLNDTERITYLQGHLCNTLKAIYIDGVNVFGYLNWSLIDNFEWDGGYDVRFGLVEVDFENSNRTRTPKQSYYAFQEIIKSNCISHCFVKRDD
ncbi:hypothetical protein ABEB36_003605 [Hypothenemus hampei]|uniref:Myrosinase 1-like n=1 Tax=Hypothenemus hampei TaxID=57062 RepID=A0ABD1F9P8_HYPHA